MKRWYRLRIWTYDLNDWVPEVLFQEYNDEDAMKHAEVISSAYPNLLMRHLEKLSWETVERYDVIPAGKTQGKVLP